MWKSGCLSGVRCVVIYLKYDACWRGVSYRVAIASGCQPCLIILRSLVSTCKCVCFLVCGGESQLVNPVKSVLVLQRLGTSTPHYIALPLGSMAVDGNQCLMSFYVQDIYVVSFETSLTSYPAVINGTCAFVAESVHLLA